VRAYAIVRRYCTDSDEDVAQRRAALTAVTREAAAVAEAQGDEAQLVAGRAHEEVGEERADAVFEPALERAGAVGGAEGLGDDVVEHGLVGGAHALERLAGKVGWVGGGGDGGGGGLE
jgi:hypothetical protein